MNPGKPVGVGLGRLSVGIKENAAIEEERWIIHLRFRFEQFIYWDNHIMIKSRIHHALTFPAVG